MNCLFYLPILLLAMLQPPSPARLPVPSEAELKRAAAVVADIYKADYEQARSPAKKIELARKLAAEALATKDDPAGHYVLLKISRDIAAQQGDLAGSLQSIELLKKGFEIDHLAMQMEAAAVAVGAAKSPKIRHDLVGLLIPAIDEAVAADRYELAKSLAANAAACVNAGEDANLRKKVAAKVKEVEGISVAFKSIQEARLLLETSPTDAAANAAVGRFLCVQKADWQRGIPMLALGNDEELKAIAILELEPATAPLKLGDAWWTVAERLAEHEQRSVQTQAARWYAKALPKLTGLNRSRIERRLELIPGLATGASPAPVKNEVEGKASPLDEKSVVGRFNIAWEEPDGKRGTSEYAFLANKDVRKETRIIGKWSIVDGHVVVRFNEADRGEAKFSFSNSGAFTGVHVWANGKSTKWRGSRQN